MRSPAEGLSMRRLPTLLALFLLAPPARADGPGWKAGVATAVITPGPMWMAGYASRKKPAEGKLHELTVKALALEAPGGPPLVVVTADLCGVSRELTEEVAAAVRKKAGLPRERLMVTV